MNDLISIIIPNQMKPDEILLIDMYKDIQALIGSKKELKVAFLDKLSLIKSIYRKKMPKDNSNNCLFVPFGISHKNLKVNDVSHIVEELLKKISKKPLSIRGHTLLTKRFILYPDVNYNFILFLVDAINTDDLKVTKTFWCNKNDIGTFYDLHNYFLIGNEVEHILNLTNYSKFQTADDTNLYEYKFSPYNTNIRLDNKKNLSLLHKVLIESNSDNLIQNYIFADFMMNSYPCQVMSYPQFIGFAVARGYYMKRCRRLFEVFKDDKAMHMLFEEFLFGCVCMDLSSPHSGYIREARGNLIFKYYDYNKDNMLDFAEMGCLVKRMRKKMGLVETMDKITLATENIMKLFNKDADNKSIRQTQISLKSFQKGLSLPELDGLTYLLRFSVPYLEKTRALMGRYMQSLEDKNMAIEYLRLSNVDFELIPYFIKEAYSTKELFDSMIYYSTNYSAVQKLLQKMDEKNKIAIAKYKVSTIFTGLFNQVIYYLSEISFDIYNSETLFPLRNPIFLILLFTAIAMVDPQLFNSSALFWNNIISFFIFNMPALIIGLKHYRQRSLANDDEEPDNADSSVRLDSGHWTNKHKEVIKGEGSMKDHSRMTLYERMIGYHQTIAEKMMREGSDLTGDSSRKKIKKDGMKDKKSENESRDQVKTKTIKEGNSTKMEESSIHKTKGGRVGERISRNESSYKGNEKETEAGNCTTVNDSSKEIRKEGGMVLFGEQSKAERMDNSFKSTIGKNGSEICDLEKKVKECDLNDDDLSNTKIGKTTEDRCNSKQNKEKLIRERADDDSNKMCKRNQRRPLEGYLNNDESKICAKSEVAVSKSEEGNKSKGCQYKREAPICDRENKEILPAESSCVRKYKDKLIRERADEDSNKMCKRNQRRPLEGYLNNDESKICTKSEVAVSKPEEGNKSKGCKYKREAPICDRENKEILPAESSCVRKYKDKSMLEKNTDKITTLKDDSQSELVNASRERESTVANGGSDNKNPSQCKETPKCCNKFSRVQRDS